jgi:EAL domain-containing protein (putative c-di-GMP-specific phosphodiesterase class I)
MFRDTQATIVTLELLRALGVRIAMDDFGTGYSSLAYLRRFPVDILKIARELIGAPGEAEREAWAFAKAILALGRSLGLTVVAEGIETDEQLRMLRRLGCELGQGYLFGRPATAKEIEAQLIEGATGPLGQRVTA